MNKYNIDPSILIKLKTIMVNLKTFLTGFLKTLDAIPNKPLKLIITFALGIISFKLLKEKPIQLSVNELEDSKGNKINKIVDDFRKSISKIDSKSNNIKISPTVSKKYIKMFIKICYSMLNYIKNNTERIIYKILIFLIIRQLLLSVFKFDLLSLKKYLVDLYSNDKFMLSNIIDKIKDPLQIFNKQEFTKIIKRNEHGFIYFAK